MFWYEVGAFQPVFSSNDFKGADRAEDTDSLLDQIYQEFNAGNARFADDMKVEFPVVGKTDKGAVRLLRNTLAVFDLGQRGLGALQTLGLCHPIRLLGRCGHD